MKTSVYIAKVSRKQGTKGDMHVKSVKWLDVWTDRFAWGIGWSIMFLYPNFGHMFLSTPFHSESIEGTSFRLFPNKSSYSLDIFDQILYDIGNGVISSLSSLLKSILKLTEWHSFSFNHFSHIPDTHVMNSGAFYAFNSCSEIFLKLT